MSSHIDTNQNLHSTSWCGAQVVQSTDDVEIHGHQSASQLINEGPVHKALHFDGPKERPWVIPMLCSFSVVSKVATT